MDLIVNNFKVDNMPLLLAVPDIKVIYKTDKKLRSLKKDRLCEYEDKMVLQQNVCMWHFKEIEKEMTTDINLDIEKVKFQFQTTLPYSEKPSDIKRLTDIWKLYYRRVYYEKTDTKPEFRNMPTGYLNAKVVFVGEAPGWGGEPKDYGGRVYTFGRNSMLFRMLSMKIFGPCWYTNICKAAIPNNAKLRGAQEDFAMDFLMNEIDMIKPKAIICLGNYVFETLAQHYGTTHMLYRIYHPSYVLRNGNNETRYKANMQEVKKQIERKELING